ncbi:hypothetical protein [Chroococcidiopsis sp. SAG 2025]|uniref:hypothetical protein n=1 Tax=Chroococcidiopsis sp. SAG 2025 TaxID=171389 RepID=UPI002937276C|nr:hypothetical protein [Chroococcidiopsis sp. SAG 2025]
MSGGDRPPALLILSSSFGTFRTVRVQAVVEGSASELADKLELTSELKSQRSREHRAVRRFLYQYFG